jgi:thymidylate synthase (FAD)
MQVELLDVMGNDLSVVNAARVSFNKVSEELSERDTKLITYLAKHKHRSPFNHAFLSFRVKAPVFVARQLQKHEYLTWNEVSRRYVDEEPEFYLPEVWRKRADNKKQGSLDEEVRGCLGVYINFLQAAEALYKAMLDKGVAPEQARMVLPQSMMTEWIWSGSLGAFMKMLNLRLDEHTQKETRELCAKIAERVEFYFPISYKALREHPIL